MEYNPVMDFWKNAIQFLFKQTPAIVFCVVACGLLWNRMEQQDAEAENKIDRINREWSESLNIARQDWLMCEQKRQALEIEVARMSERLLRVERRGKK